MYQFWIIRNPAEVLTIHIHEVWDCLLVELLTNDVQKRADSKREHFRLVVRKGKTADLLMPEQNEVCEHCHCHARVIAVNRRIRVKVAFPARAEQLQIPPCRKHNAFHAVTANVLHECFCQCARAYNIRVVVPYIYPLRRDKYG